MCGIVNSLTLPTQVVVARSGLEYDYGLID